MKRRNFLGLCFIGGITLATGMKAYSMNFFGKKGDKDTPEGRDTSGYPFTLTDQEWREKLSEEQYRVLRGHGTERAFSSPLDSEKRNGTFLCAGCDHPLFSSQHKFDSRTGWPSFWKPLDGSAIGTTKDFKLILPRIEVHCANCGGHQGHVFNDGPQPTGLRYCINGVAMRFKPSEA
jgi:peptide-methionine (R)-S-oxide reductase